MPSILDREISSANEDAFGHRHFAQALRSLIESPEHSPPFSIGLLGGWGTGKSSIKELYTADLRDDADSGSGKSRSQRVHCVTFNAWRFGGRDQDIKRALLRHVFLELGGKEENLEDRLFRQVSETRDKPKTLRELTKSTLRAWIAPLPAFLIAVVVLFLLFLAGKHFLHPGEASQSILFLCIFGLLLYIQKHVKPLDIKGSHPITRVALPSTSSEQFEDMLLAQLRRYKKGEDVSLDGRNGKSCERLVVFVDDLDRLSADEMVLGLDAVRTFMEIPKSRLPNGLGLVFVISCDEAKVADALAKGRNRSGELPATVFNHSDARRYLDRIFQFRLEIPPPPRNDMREFATRQLKRLTYITDDLTARGVELPPLVDRMIHVGVSDPRNALQIVNAFAQAWWIAVRREREGVGSARPGGLHEGAVTRHPISLGAICAMKVSFPDFYRDLLEDSSFLQAFMDVVLRGRSLDKTPEASRRKLIERYLVAQTEGRSTVEVKAEHRPLRQYLSSLGGLRWADRLQSLLLLSEDPTTRRLGASILPIYNAFVSGDTRGVLEGMGRHIDTSALNQDQARNLYQLFEDMRSETEARRSNAARVIADLMPRIPAPHASMLLGELCRDLDSSLSLRSQLGPKRVVALLEDANKSDRKSITSRLVSDITSTEHPIALSLQSLSPPGLDEAVEMVEIIVPFALATRADCGELEQDAESSLLDWLITRNVRTEDGEGTQLPYEKLEAWLSGDAGDVASALGVRYGKALAERLESDETVEFDLAPALKRVQAIVSRSIETGGDERHEGWSLLLTYIGLSYAQAVEFAWELGVPLLGKANEDEVSSFVEQFAHRLQTSEGETIDPEKAFNPLSNAVTRFIDTLHRESLGALVALTDRWSTTEATAELATELTRRLLPSGSSIEAAITSKWAPRLLNDLPMSCVRLLASRFKEQTNGVQTAVQSSLQFTINNDRIPDAVDARFSAFIDAVPQDCWSVAPLQEYLNLLLPQLAARFSNPNGYLASMMPRVARLLQSASPSVFGHHIQQLFIQAKGHSAHYPMLHESMTGLWPTPSAEFGPYNPAVIFTDAKAFVHGFTMPDNIKVVRSMRDMFERGVVPSSERANLLEAICVVWKTAPKQTADLIATYSNLSVEQAYVLVTTIDVNNDQQTSALTRAWRSVSQAMSPDARVAMLRTILSRGVVSSTSEADVCLRVWLDVQDDDGKVLLHNTLPAQDIPDEQRSRVWRQAVSRGDGLGPEFFIEIVPQVIVLPNLALTGPAVFEDEQRIKAILGERKNHSRFSRALMDVFTEAKSTTVKGQICKLCYALVGDAVLKSFGPKSLTPEEFAIVEGVFGDSAEVRRLKDAVVTA